MAMQHQPFETAEGHSVPLVRQVSVFLENRPGQLLRLTQILDEQDVKILGLSQVDAGDSAVVRLVFDRTDEALEALRKAGFAVHVSEIIVVRLGPGKRAMMNIWSVLLMAEVNVAYTYPLLFLTAGPCLALCVDSAEIAIDTLQRRNFEVLGEADLEG
ncbi:MAG: acetolactate synthase [Planctomycetes bacterium]|nr:acetolactate synthase [Planctomycetota bacterium]